MINTAETNTVVQRNLITNFKSFLNHKHDFVTLSHSTAFNIQKSIPNCFLVSALLKKFLLN